MTPEVKRVISEGSELPETVHYQPDIHTGDSRAAQLYSVLLVLFVMPHRLKTQPTNPPPLQERDSQQRVRPAARLPTRVPKSRAQKIKKKTSRHW